MSWIGIGWVADSSRRNRLLIVFAFACGAMLVSATSASAVGSISGKVTDETSKAAIEGALVCAYGSEEGEEEEFLDCTETGAAGTYTLTSLPEDEHVVVEFWAGFLGYATEYYNNKSSFAAADEVNVTSGAVTGINAELTKYVGRGIEGTVNDAATTTPLAEVEVCAFDLVEEDGGCDYTESNGSYAILGLTPGQYYVEFFAPGYAFQFYNGAGSFSEADLVTVTDAGKTVGINASLVKSTTPPVVIPPPVVTTPPAVTPPAVVPKGKAKGKKCKKGFRPKKIKGKTRCVKIKKGRKKGR